jgi:hypothetical protein
VPGLASGRSDPAEVNFHGQRPDRRATDREARLGTPVVLSGLSFTVTAARLERTEDVNPELVISVALRNVSGHPQPYHALLWATQGSDGRRYRPVGSRQADDLRAGDLAPGDEITGSLTFDASRSGEYYVIVQPDPRIDDRAVWQVTVA